MEVDSEAFPLWLRIWRYGYMDMEFGLCQLGFRRCDGGICNSDPPFKFRHLPPSAVQ